MRIFLSCLACAVAPLAHAASDIGNTERGAQVFRLCAACHSLRPGEHLTGPSLAHIWKRKAGSVEGFRRYSDAIRQSGVTWDQATLDGWLSDPAAFIPGTTMTFPGVKQSQPRQDLIAYLKAVAEGSAPAPAKGGRGMMGMGGPMDLRALPAEAQVASIRHCGDTYTIATADGKTERIWEFNLRLKIDSSSKGPPAGKPVVIGAGMRGDRVSIVFASPAEIGQAIKESCD